MTEFFHTVGTIEYEGPHSDNPFAFRWYDKDRIVLGKTMAEHLRFGVCYWHSFNWDGSDVFGEGTFDRPWIKEGTDPLHRARTKMEAAFEFMEKLGAPFFAFHDRDIAPAGATFAESCCNLDAMVEEAARHMENTGIGLLWGTAQAFHGSHYAAGAATNPDPTIFAYAAAQVKHCMDATKRLGGENYVLWGGREGYETLLNTDLRQEMDQLGRFLNMVVEYKHQIGFEGAILIEPKPQEPTKHQYDYDTATVFGFLQRYGLESEVKVNLEVNHATLAGHTFEHEVATAMSNGIFGSVDANRGDDRLGWDTDQFPNSVEQMTLAMYEILRGGGFTTGGLLFDTKLRRQSMARDDLFLGHIGAMDTMARALLAAAEILEQGQLSEGIKERYSGWSGDLGARILDGRVSLGELHDLVRDSGLEPEPVSGRQEKLENLVNRSIEKSGQW